MPARVRGVHRNVWARHDEPRRTVSTTPPLLHDELPGDVLPADRRDEGVDLRLREHRVAGDVASSICESATSVIASELTLWSSDIVESFSPSQSTILLRQFMCVWGSGGTGATNVVSVARCREIDEMRSGSRACPARRR
jgi:hypothetical protein